MAHRYRVHHRRRHRNPLGLSRQNLTFAGWGVVGAVGAYAAPAVVLPSKNTGIVGYGLNLASAIAMKMVGNFISSEAGDGMFIGGLVATGLRIVKDQLGSKIPGLGAYWQSYLPNLPGTSDPYGRMPNPAPPVIAAAAARGMSGGRFTSGRFRRN